MTNDISTKFEEFKRQRELKIANSSVKRKTKNVTRELAYDQVTGEVLSDNVTTQIITSKGSEPPFIKLYLDDLILLCDLPTKSSAILWELIKNMSYDNEIALNSYRKKKIIETLDIKMSTLNNALSSFVKKEILFRVGPGTFIPNPYLFARGSWDDIAELRMIVSYKAGKREIQLEIDGKKADDYNKEHQPLDNLENALRRAD